MVKDNLGFTFAAARQTLTSVAGLELLTSLIRRLDLIRSIRSEIRVKKIDYGFREEEHLIPLLLNIALRRTSFTDLAWLAREEKLLKKSLGFGKFPKERAVAMHLEKYGKEHIAGLKRSGQGLFARRQSLPNLGMKGTSPVILTRASLSNSLPNVKGSKPLTTASSAILPYLLLSVASDSASTIGSCRDGKRPSSELTNSSASVRNCSPIK